MRRALISTTVLILLLLFGAAIAYYFGILDKLFEMFREDVAFKTKCEETLPLQLRNGLYDQCNLQRYVEFERFKVVGEWTGEQCLIDVMIDNRIILTKTFNLSQPVIITCQEIIQNIQ